jgi:Zn-finger nucleic acid-binding protein
MADTVICLRCGGALEPPADATAGFPVRLCKCAAAAAEAKSVFCPRCGGSIKVGTRACPYCSSTVATCRCASCLAWNLAGAAHCQRCGRPLLAAEAGAGQASGCGCPRCGAKLQAREYADLSVDECDQCGGLFLSTAMVDQVVAAHDTSTGLRLALPMRAIRREPNVRYIRCPVCQKMMNRQAFARLSGIVIDVCKAHGIWFDGGELSEALRFVEQGGLQRTREREAAEAAERDRRSRTEIAIAEATLAFGGDPEGSGFGWSRTNNTFAELLRSIAKVWR